MAFPEDLLVQARVLATLDRTRPKQASLRRAVSTAYYALFHLLTGAAALNWKPSSQRFAFARILDHARMYRTSNRVSKLPFPGEPPHIAGQLRSAASTFSDLQELRHAADYDGNRKWTRTAVLESIALTEEAFRSWKVVHKKKTAQDYLLQFLVQR